LAGRWAVRKKCRSSDSLNGIFSLPALLQPAYTKDTVKPGSAIPENAVTQVCPACTG
jgi:hypothetical protein